MRGVAAACSGLLAMTLLAMPPFALPAVAQAAPLSGEAGFVLRGLRLLGSTVLAPSEVEGVAAPFLGRPVSVREIEEIRHQVTLLYVDRGYLNSGVVIPDQTVADGVLTLQAVEGRITEIELVGNRHTGTAFLAERLRRGISTPFNVNSLLQQQQILLQEPFLRRLALEVQPGVEPGEARLRGEVTEAPRYQVTLGLGNSQSPTVGELRGQAAGSLTNLLGLGDVLSLQYGRSAGLNDGSIAYSVPLAADDTRLSLRYDVNTTLVIAREVRLLDIESRYRSLALGLTRPFFRTPEQALTLGLSLERRRARTYLLGEPFSFSDGAEDGRTDVTVLRFSQDWLDRNAQRVLALRSTFSLGLDLFGATTDGGRTDGQFLSWLGQAQYVRRIAGGAEVLARGNLQLSNDPLFPIEQFVLGGMTTVRGYREYLTAADNAATATLELRAPIARLPLPLPNTTVEDGVVQAAAFYDRGIGWNTRRSTPGDADLSSIGVGLRWLVRSGMTGEVYYGHALRDAPRGNTLQDRGVHFRFVVDLL